MATYIRTSRTVPTDEQWAAMTTRYNMGIRDEALAAAAKRAKDTGYPHFVYVTRGGFQVSGTYPSLPAGQRFYEIKVERGEIIGNLYEA
jgi:hypothetical protein